MNDNDIRKAVKKGIRDVERSANNQRAADNFAGTGCGCWIGIIWLVIMIGIVISILNTKGSIEGHIVFGFIVCAVFGLIFKIGAWFNDN